MRWRKPPVDAEHVKSLARQFDLDLLTASILVRRGIVSHDALPYYLESDVRYLHSPFLFPDMVDVVERIHQAAEEGEKVLVFGDRDVDGITSTSVIVTTLRELGIDVQWRVPLGDDPYGLTLEEVERFAGEDGSLIVTVDCGITNVEEIDRAVQLGIDALIIDHHNPHEALPPAVAIVNPKVGDDYPFDGLCACALAGKVRQAIYYGRTELFGRPVTLLNCRPGNDTVMVDAIRLENGIEVDRVTEAMVPGIAQLEGSRLAPFLVGSQLVCYDEAVQRRLLQQAFGSRVEIYLIDLASQVFEQFPSLAGRSLLQMREGSRLARYSNREAEEIDVLFALYRAVVDAKFPAMQEALVPIADLVAVATLADMMPIADENRILVKTGLEVLNSDPHPGLRALMQEQGILGKRIASRDVGWNIGPVINASGRMGQPDKAVELLLETDSDRRRNLAAEVVGMNRKRKKAGDDAWKQVLPKADANRQELDERLIMIHAPNIHRGVTGIIAGRLARHFNVPAAVITTVDESAVGSVRSARGFVATDFLSRFSGILEKWGGHDEAAGFNLPLERLDEFWSKLKEVVPSILLDEEEEETVEIDAELPTSYLNPDLEQLVQRFEPYGQQNPPLRFLARNMVLEQVDFIGKGEEHLRLLLAGGGFKWPAVFWRASDRVKRDFDRGDRVDGVFEFTKNFYNGNETVQLVIVDLRRSDLQIATMT